MSRTLVIVAHMDDEVLSSGGLIRKRVCCGEEVMVLALHGRKYFGSDTESSAKRQFEHARAAKDLLGYSILDHAGFEEGEPTRVGYYKLLGRIEHTLLRFKPTEVVIPGAGDLNQDHRHLNEVCRIALRPANRGIGTQEGGIRRVLESIAHDRLDGPAQANYAVVLTEKMVQTVIEAMRCYADEMRPHPHPRSVKNMEARYRFYGAQFGYDFVEPYRLVVEVE